MRQVHGKVELLLAIHLDLNLIAVMSHQGLTRATLIMAAIAAPSTAAMQSTTSHCVPPTCSDGIAVTTSRNRLSTAASSIGLPSCRILILYVYASPTIPLA